MKFWLRHFWLASVLIISAGYISAAPLLYPLTPEQGLSQGSVNDLMIDQEGFLWLATAGGVNRYDSNQITQLSSSAHRLKELRFTQIMQDSSQRIWAASATSGIYLYNPDSGLFDPFMPMPPQAEQQRQSQLIALIEYDKDTLLFAIDDAVYKLPLQTATPQLIFRLSDHGIKNGWVRTLLQHDKQLFIGAFNGLIHFDLATGKHRYIPYLLNPQATDNQKHIKYLQVQQQRLWIGTVEGLYSINYQDLLAFLQHGTPFTAQENIPQRNIWDLHWQQEQALVATEQGLYVYMPQLSRLRFVLKFSDSALSLFDDNIVDIVADKDGGYWLASRDDGAFYWHPRSNAFSHLSRSTQLHMPLSNDKVYSLLKGDNDTLWVGTSNGLNKLQLSTGNIKQYFVNADPKALWHSGTVNRLFSAADSKLWFSSGSGLNYFDPVTEQLLPLPVNNEANAALLGTGSSAYYLHQGIFYFITANDFLQYNPEDGSIKPLHAFRNQLQRSYYRGILGPLPQRPEQLVIAAADQLWLYDTRQQQLTRFYQHEEYMPELQRRPSSMLQDKRGILWVGFPGLGLLGFNSLNLELKYHFSEANQLASDAVYSLQQDNNGDIWFSSQQGISRLNPDTLKIEHFTKTDGLTVHEYNNSSGIRLTDGKLAFGSMRGLTFVDPAQLETEKIQPRIAITDISLQSAPEHKMTALLNNRSLTYPHDALGIQIHFSSLNFRDSHKMRYRFWLQGNKNYHYPEQSNNQVIFPQLDSGHYVFNVVSISPVTGEESPPAQLFLYIKPAPWLSGWAITAYALLLLLLGQRLYRFRRKQHLLLKSAHDKAKLSEQRLKQALESVNSGAWEWQAKGNILFASRIYTMLGYDEQMNPLTMNQHLLLIHPDDRASFEQQWQRFLQQTEPLFDITYRMRHRNEQWLWFRDQGKATEQAEDGKISKASGTFSNITETRASQEKAKLFGEAFRQARDWVVILDAQQRVVAANQSFSTAFDYTASQLEQPKIHHLGISLVRRRFYTQLLHTLTPGQHWQGEELIITPDGRERPALINVSAVGEQQVSFFVLVFTDITAQKEAEAELRYMANYDAMTGLPNRTLLMDRIYHGIEQAKRAGKTLALCFIDLDRFKHINDSLGHDIGDLLLKEVARRLKLTLRESDTVARLGGDEFVVLLEGYKNEDNISHVARKMLSIVSQPMLLSTHTVGISPSIGIAIYPDDATNAAELLKHADVAMYHAKEAGRNNFQFFTAEMNEKAYMQLARETRLRQALQQNEFINYYQPIINTLNNSVVGVEVLLRWNTAEGIVSPYHFIPLAEELRLIVNITQRLLERALADLKQWRQHGYDIYLSVNLSTQHLEQTNLAEQTRILLEKYQLPASCLRFEVTESALMRDHQSAIETMLALSQLGILLALDDFGTGYSSLKYLKELPIDAIKIDRSFVQDIGIDNSDETIIETMLTMASSLGMYCVAEGVETERQLAFFTQRGCCLIQGYLFSVPLPADDLQKLLDSQQFNVPRRKDGAEPT